MALEESNNGIPATMLVGPTSYPYPVQNGGMGGFGNGQDGWWIVLLIILLAAGNNFGFGGNNGFGGMPVMINDGNNGSVQRGFDQAAVMSGISGIQSGIHGLSTQLCGCCGDMQMALANGFAGVEQGANARQIANMQTAFAGQTAMSQGFNSVQSQLANCCCENRLASADLKYTVATENCADRAALSDGIRDIIASQTASTQRILDKLCDQELYAERRENDQLRQQLNFANLQASQVAQTAELRQSGANQLNQLVSELRSCPIPAQPVYGSQPIFTCNNGGCGCGNF